MNIKKNGEQFIKYLIVGGVATIVEWAVFYVLHNPLNMNYAFATTLAFVVSTFANWACGRLLMFKGEGKLLTELAKIYATSIVGLLMNLFIMWIAIDCLWINSNISKVIATGIVFFWNFLVRKLVIYKI